MGSFSMRTRRACWPALEAKTKVPAIASRKARPTATVRRHDSPTIQYSRFGSKTSSGPLRGRRFAAKAANVSSCIAVAKFPCIQQPDRPTIRRPRNEYRTPISAGKQLRDIQTETPSGLPAATSGCATTFGTAGLGVRTVVRLMVRTEQNQAARAPDHQCDEGETEEQIELRFLQCEGHRGEAQRN